MVGARLPWPAATASSLRGAASAHGTSAGSNPSKPQERSPGSRQSRYLAEEAGSGRDSRLHATRGGGEPCTSQGSVVSCPRTARTVTGADIPRDPFTLILGLAGCGEKTKLAQERLHAPHNPQGCFPHPQKPSYTWLGQPEAGRGSRGIPNLWLPALRRGFTGSWCQCQALTADGELHLPAGEACHAGGCAEIGAGIPRGG